ERLLREQVELLGGVVGRTTDPGEAEEHAEGLDRLIRELRTKNESLRVGKGGREGATPPRDKGP
ncbi:MAG TPA: hypothetical protein VH092_02800, partial [Urbifossiella sp.]|nr:hypothetical protein [Urbifossiella sp.]